MTVYETLYFLWACMVAGFLIGMIWSMFFDWVKF